MITKNVADRSQVMAAASSEEKRDERWLNTIRAVLNTYEGRELWWELLAKAGVFKSIWRASAEIHYLSGQQDFGHYLMAEAVRANQELFLIMQREAAAREKQFESGITAKQGDKNEHSNRG
jgi:hypothetical protein